MWARCVVFLCSVLGAVTYAWVSDADCITADGSAGRCTSPSECPSVQQGNTIPCRYSGGFTMRICCPQSRPTFTNPYKFQARGDPYMNDQPLVFPTEFEYTSQYNPFQRPTIGFNSFSSNQPMNPFHRPPFDSRPLIGNQPMFGYETTPSPYRPDYVARPGYRPTYNERPDDRPTISKPAYNERPSFSSESEEDSYERPNYSNTGTGGGSFNRPDIDERPRPNRPTNTRPGYNEGPNFESGLVNTQSNSRPSYNERPDYNQRPNQNERPIYNERPSQNERPVYNERPDYNQRPNQNERPIYNERPNQNERPDYNERPDFNQRPNERPVYNERPDYNGKPSYNDRPVYNERPSTSYSPNSNNKPSVTRPGSNGGSSWNRPTTKKTTPRPTWSVSGDNDGESTSSRKRISEQKCEEYSRPVSETINVLPLSIDSEAVPLKVQKCEFSAVKLIVGGEAAELGEFPHMAAVGFRPRRGEMQWNCGGTLISERYVLTAAHCINTTFGNPVTVRLGEYNLARDNDGAEPVDYGIERIIVHPSYIKTKKYNDIALIRLSRNVQFNKWVRPACLPSSSKVTGDPTATGWGRTDFVGKLSDTLMKVSLNMIDNQQCNSFYRKEGPGSASFSNGITDTMLCAGVLEGGRDTCLGDSGGPLSITRKDNACIHSVVGITSFGKVCGARNSPGVYTKVHKYLSWIERTVWSSA